MITESVLNGPQIKLGNKFELAKYPKGIEKTIPIIVPTQAIQIVSSSFTKTRVNISLLKSGGNIKVSILAICGNEFINLSHVIDRLLEDQTTITDNRI